MRLLFAALALAALAGCSDAKPKPEPQAAAAAAPTPQPIAPEPVPGGLKITDEVVGTGPEAVAGKTVSVHYTGWLDSNHKEFDSSRSRNRPFEFRLGAGQVIKGWDLGVQGMKVGGKRNLVIPPALGYGQMGAGNGLIPGGAVLVFDVELLEVK